MKRQILFFTLLLIDLTLSAQTVNWAMNVSDAPYNRKLTVDPASNLYLYGYNESYYPGPNEGSRFMKFSPDGNLLISKTWKGRLYISSMVNDAHGSFYFCGHFRDNKNDEGFSLTTRGKSDGFIGKMDESGKVQWTIGFGGAKDDKATDIAFNADSTQVIITGGVDTTVSIYEYNIYNGPKAIFVASFDLTGGLKAYRTFAYHPKEHGSNMGLEIDANGSGGYYLLADRMGDHWSNNKPSGSPMEGRYLFNLDNNLNILWSQFIISSSCYYGYSCAGMSVQKGEACVPSFCSGKYGGTGVMQKLEANAGAKSWSITNNDGTYYDTYAHAGNVLYVGNEEANGCPCEDNNPGFARVKMLTADNTDKILLSKYAFHFYNVTESANGSIYVFGYAGGDDPQLQGIPLSDGYLIFSMKSPPSSFSGPDAGSKLSVYPNPSEGYAEIIHENIMQELVIMRSDGTVLRSYTPFTKAMILRDLAPGYYLIRVKDSDGYSSGRLIVEK